MKNSSLATKGQAKDYLACRETWLKCILADRHLETRAKLVATAIYFNFNQERFNREGKLWAWPGLRRLDKETGQSRNTVKLALDDLESAGYLKPHPRYDTQRRRHNSHLYLALVPQTLSKGNGKDTGGGSDGCTRVGHPGDPGVG